MKMNFKNITKYLLICFFFLIPSAVFAADLDITCYSDKAPEIVRNVDPLFQLTGFVPGSSATRTIYIENTDDINDCRIYFLSSGDSNLLTDKIEVNVSGGLFNGPLTEYIGNTRLLMANLSPNEDVTRTITIGLPTDAGNIYTSKNASFDITVQSEWGDDTMVENNGGEDTQGEVGGVTDQSENTKGPIISSLTELLGIGGPGEDLSQDTNGENDIEQAEKESDTDKKKEEIVLGEKDNGECTEKTLWWLPIIVQLILTLFILVIDKGMLKRKNMKMILSFLLGLTTFLIIRRIGCGCNPVWLCENHWILNLIISLISIFKYFERKREMYPSQYNGQETL